MADREKVGRPGGPSLPEYPPPLKRIAIPFLRDRHEKAPRILSRELEIACGNRVSHTDSCLRRLSINIPANTPESATVLGSGMGDTSKLEKVR